MGPEMEGKYSFRIILKDLELWNEATEIERERRGAVVAMRLTGTAKEIARDIDAVTLRHDCLPDGGMAHLPELEILVRALKNKFCPLDQERQISAVEALMRLNRKYGENIYTLIARWDIARHNAANVGGIQLPYVGTGWMFLSIAGVPREKWTTLLAQTQGMLPRDKEVYDALLLPPTPPASLRARRHPRTTLFGGQL